MLFGMAAASSAIDLIKTLTQGKAASKSSQTTGFSTANDAGATSTTSSGTATRSGQQSLIAPDTMNALLAAQGQSQTTSTTSASRSDSLTNLFNTLDADGSGGISKSEFESALGAGGTNIANADSVFDKLDKDGDGSVSRSELASALKPKHKAHGPKQAGGQDALLQALDGANSTSTTNSDGSTTTSITYADGSTVTMSQPAASSQSTSATRSYNALEQMIQQQANMLTQNVSSSVSVSV